MVYLAYAICGLNLVLFFNLRSILGAVFVMAVSILLLIWMAVMGLEVFWREVVLGLLGFGLVCAFFLLQMPRIPQKSAKIKAEMPSLVFLLMVFVLGVAVLGFLFFAVDFV